MLQRVLCGKNSSALKIKRPPTVRDSVARAASTCVRVDVRVDVRWCSSTSDYEVRVR
jgi:hypothetical protein